MLLGLVVVSSLPIGAEMVMGLYTVRFIAPLQTRLDPLRTVGSFQVDSYTPEQIREDKERVWPGWKKDFHRQCDIGASALSADAEISASDLATVTRIEWLTAPEPGKDPIFFTAQPTLLYSTPIHCNQIGERP